MKSEIFWLRYARDVGFFTYCNIIKCVKTKVNSGVAFSEHKSPCMFHSSAGTISCLDIDSSPV